MIIRRLPSVTTPAARHQVVQAILYTNPDGVPPVINSTRLLAHAGLHVAMICRDDRQPEHTVYPPEIRVRRIRKRWPSPWAEYACFILQSIRHAERSAGVIIGHEMYGLLPARLLATLCHRPLIYHCHDFVEESRQLSRGARLVRRFERWFARTADLVVVPDAGRAQVIERELRLRRPPLVVANAPLTRPDGSRQVLRRALRERGYNLGAIVFRQGVLGPGHGIEMTIRSLPFWASTRWGLVLLGRGEAAYLAHLLALARSLGVEERLAILPPVPYDQVARYTLGADVGHALYDPVNVNHVYAGTASNKIMEYLAAGVPVLVPDSDSFHLFSHQYRCGIAVDAQSPSDIARGVNCLLGNAAGRQAMAQAGVRTFEQVFRFERQFAPVLQEISQLCGPR